jgi:hypothetical protein
VTTVSIINIFFRFKSNINERVHEEVFSRQAGIYINRSRRWITVSLQLRGGEGFRREHFLLDTGSPKSIMIKEIADMLKSPSGYSIHDEEYRSIEIEGMVTRFELQLFGKGEPRTQNINLLGTNFLNGVVLLDDYGSKTIMVVKRASPVMKPV